MSARKAYALGEVVWAPDPYHSDDPEITRQEGRPSLVLSTPATFPAHGEDYLCCALTSVPDSRDPLRITLGPQDWRRGQPRKPSYIDPKTLITLKHDWIAGLVGEVAVAKVNRARRIVRGFF